MLENSFSDIEVKPEEIVAASTGSKRPHALDTQHYLHQQNMQLDAKRQTATVVMIAFHTLLLLGYPLASKSS